MTNARRPAKAGSGPGVVAPRRALVRWAWRSFRREWRQQALVVALLAVAVAAAVGSTTIVYNTAPADDAELGSASHLLRFDAADPRKLAAGLAAAKRSFGTTDVVARGYSTVPGGVERVNYAALDPRGPYVGALLSLRRGSYPERADQVAVTDGVARLMRLELGSTLALDGRRRTVVGIVENPRKLSEEFALVTPSSLVAPHYVTVLVDATDESVRSFAASQQEGRSALLQTASRPNRQNADALAMFSVATVFLLLASLVAAAGFAVIAQRRLRQLGMLAAVGATQKHLRLVLLTGGALVGALGTLCGTVAGIALWVAAAPTVETLTDHRIDRLSLPWGLIALTVVLAFLAATAAAWWPGRTVARLPVVLALSGRPPEPRPARHAATAAVLLISVGFGCLALSGQSQGPLIVAGIVATILGTLLLGPPTIRIFSRLAGRASVAPRLALRDLARYQARSGAALAAVTLALGIAATVVVVASAEAAKRNAQPPNLSERQIRVHLGPPEDREGIPVETLARHETLAARVRQLAGQLDQATVIPLDKVVERRNDAFVNTFTGIRQFGTRDLARTTDGRLFRQESSLFVATPALLRYLGIDPRTVDATTDFLAYPSVPVDELVIPSFRTLKASAVTNVQRITTGRSLFGSFDFGFNEVLKYAPPTLITLQGLHRRGWEQVPSGWLVESSRPLTSDQISDAREIAANAGFTLEVQRGKTSFARTMAVTTAVGALLALGILALTVGLIRGESAGDLRILTATGATSSIRRTLTASTAGALSLLGALLGVGGAYVALVAMHYDDLGYLSDVPLTYLVLAVLGVPLAAAATGWLASGREPPALARAVIE
jgi:putative ABC transport system permease protein